jgi:hypothetical protein
MPTTAQRIRPGGAVKKPNSPSNLDSSFVAARPRS